MKKYILFLTISSVLILLNSCFLPTSVDPPYESEPWGCLINSDGTGFEWVMRGDDQATFTQDSQKIVYRQSDGIFTRDFEGNVEQISTATNYDYFSDDLQYLIDEYNDENEIFRMDIDGTNRINLTETPDSREYDSHISSDGNWITYVSEVDAVYSIWIMDIDGENKVKVITDSVKVFYKPKLNLMDNKIYYIHKISFSNSNLKSIYISGLNNEIVFENVYNDNKISELGNIVSFTSSTNHVLKILNTSDNEIISVGDDCYGIFNINYFGDKIIWLRGFNSGIINLFNLDSLKNFEIEHGSYPTISPNGEKIFFIKNRELPIED